MSDAAICPLCRGESWHDLPCSGRPARKCRECGGVWCRSSYNDEIKASRAGATLTGVDASETAKPKICPDCGRLLLALETAGSPRLRVDRCLGCAGAWFDPAAWREAELLGHDDALARTVSVAALEGIDPHAIAAVREGVFASLLGPHEHGKLRDIRHWIIGHPARAVMLAYLMEQNDPRWQRPRPSGAEDSVPPRAS